MSPAPGPAAPVTQAAPARPPGPRGRTALKIALVMAGAVLAQLALVAAFAGVLADPALKSAEVGLVARGPAAAVPLPGVTYLPLASEAAARQEVTSGTLPAALVTDGKTQALYLDGASGPSPPPPWKPSSAPPPSGSQRT